MLDGVVRFPPEFAARYRAKGYWEDRSLRDVFAERLRQIRGSRGDHRSRAVRYLCATQRTLGRIWR